MDENFISNVHVEIIREIDGTDKLESKKFDGPIWIQAKQVSQYFGDNIMAFYTIGEVDKIENEIIHSYLKKITIPTQLGV